MNNLRSIPPSRYDDIRADNQCYVAVRVVCELFNQGIELEQIESKVRERFKIKHWQWKDLIWEFEPILEIHFGELVALNKDETNLIPLSTPEAEPCFVLTANSLPILNELIITDTKLLRHKTEKIIQVGIFGPDKTMEISEIYPFPNPKLTKLFLYLRDHYVENGMICRYNIRKWQLGLDKCEIDFYEE